jgi:hypothetical protein
MPSPKKAELTTSQLITPRPNVDEHGNWKEPAGTQAPSVRIGSTGSATWKAKAVDEVVQGQTKGKSSFSLSSE